MDKYQIECDLIEWEKDLAENEESLKNLCDDPDSQEQEFYERDIEFYEAEIAKAKLAIATLKARYNPPNKPLAADPASRV